jgi:hypothetical protein
MNSKELKSKVMTLGNRLTPRMGGNRKAALRGSLGNREGRRPGIGRPGRVLREPAGSP